MITENEATRLLKRADPARVDDAAAVADPAVYLDALRTRSINVKLIDTDRPPTDPTTRTNSHRWPLITAAAAVVLVVAAALVVATRDDETDLTTASEPGAEDVARGFLDALAAYDADRAMTYLAEDALARGPIVSPAETSRTPDELRLALAEYEASGFKQTITDCEQRAENASGVRVRCAFEFHQVGSDQLGLGPYRGSYWDLIVSDGKVVSATANTEFDANLAEHQTWEPFNRWVSTVYPHDAAVMYGRPSEESIRLWAQHVPEYLTTRQAFVARAEAICTAAHARLNERLTASGLSTRNDEGLEYERAAADVLDGTVAELRALPAPEAFLAEFDHGYALVEQLAQALHGTGTDAADTIREILGLGLDLDNCTFSLPR